MNRVPNTSSFTPATSASSSHTSKTGFTIAVGCPGCGGELELQENFFVLRCIHCSSTLRITMPDREGGQPPAYLIKGRKAHHEVRFAIDRYCKEHGLALTGQGTQFKQIYYPYWKVDAILLRTRNKIEVIEQVNEDGTQSSSEPTRETRRTEVTLAPYSVTFPAASTMEGVPHSIGLRASYVKGEPFAPEKVQVGYRVLPVAVNWAEARELLLKTVGNVGSIDTPGFGKNRTEMYRPVGSIVYFPYWVVESYGGGGFRRWLVDGVTGQVAGTAARIESAEYDEEEKMEFGELRIGLHQCGNCGHDLPAEQSYVYLCAHCGEVTRVEEHQLFGGEIGVGCHPSTTLRVTEAADEGIGGAQPTINGGPPARSPGEGGEGEVLLPFWVMTVAPETAAKLKVLSGGLGKSGQIAVPAFRMANFEAVYRLGRRMTTAQGGITVRGVEEEDRGFAPVGVSPAEAVVLGRVMVARELVEQMAGLELPGAADTSTGMADAFTGMRLLYVPFHKEHYFYVDSVVNAVTVEKNLVPQY